MLQKESEAVSQILESRFSDEDIRLADKYHFGHPLKVYRASLRSQCSVYIWNLIGALLCTCLSIVIFVIFITFMVQFPGWFASFRPGAYLMFALFALGVVGLTRLPNVLSKLTMALTIVFSVALIVLPALTDLSFPDLFLPMFMCMSFMWGMNLFAARHNGQETRVIVCEAGLLAARKVYWYHNVHQLIPWKDIHFQQVPSTREQWRIIHRGQKPLGVLASALSAADYQNGDELFASVRERMAEAAI